MFAPIGRKIILDLMREKTITLAIFLQLFIILASSVIISNSSVFLNPETLVDSPIGIGFYSDSREDFFGSDSNNVALKFINFLQEDEVAPIYVKNYQSFEEAKTAFENNKIDVIISMSNSDFPILAKIYLPKGEIKTSVAITIIKEKFEKFEDYLRNQGIKNPNLIKLSTVNIRNKANSASASLFEALYNIVLPFILLLPGILLGGLIIDILFEDLETKTINLLMIITNFRRYLYEIILTILFLSTVQVLAWEILMMFKGIQIAHLPLITSLIVFLNLIMYLFAIFFTLIFNDKTRAQITFSFMIILLFVSAPLFSFNPIRMITKLAIGIDTVPIFIYFGVLVAIIAILTGILTYIAEKKEW